ncbi:cbs domain protein [Lentinula edodes]|uniref:Cbs domain protein n=1 Tax=Lentinula edodes TaxID=5353 RepID=A0A1Q3ED82_LENED|nr:cbs domain protein [Lentinula edodes]
MAHGRRPSQSLIHSPELASNFTATAPLSDAEDWLTLWQASFARDIIDSRIVAVDGQISVEEACDILLSEDIPCLAIKSIDHSVSGLFDFSDVNAFLTLAATKHTFSAEAVQEKPRVDDIFTAARSGHVLVSIVSNLSEKNPLHTLPYDATVVSLLEVFARGAHRVLIKSNSSEASEEEFIGIVSDRRLLTWFLSFAQQSESESLRTYLSNPLSSFSDSLPSLNLFASVVATKVVTDIGKIVVPSQSNQILSLSIQHFISLIKGPDGSMDGQDRYPVYSVLPTSTMLYTIQKLLATNAHRVFITQDSTVSSPLLSPKSSGNLAGLVSVVDILSLFARLAKVKDVDPTRVRSL